MVILEKHINKCKTCGKYRGHVIEKYNGLVPVWCRCDAWAKLKKEANPCMIFCDTLYPEPGLIWRPISDNVDEDGVFRHTPHFAGPAMF